MATYLSSEFKKKKLRNNRSVVFDKNKSELYLQGKIVKKINEKEE
jgi:hypothetical protein